MGFDHGDRYPSGRTDLVPGPPRQLQRSVRRHRGDTWCAPPPVRVRAGAADRHHASRSKARSAECHGLCAHRSGYPRSRRRFAAHPGRCSAVVRGTLSLSLKRSKTVEPGGRAQERVRRRRGDESGPVPGWQARPRGGGRRPAPAPRRSSRACATAPHAHGGPRLRRRCTRPRPHPPERAP